jgi:hypothetical protein
MSYYDRTTLAPGPIEVAVVLTGSGFGRCPPEHLRRQWPVRTASLAKASRPDSQYLAPS